MPRQANKDGQDTDDRGYDPRFRGLGFFGSELGFVLVDAVKQGLRNGEIRKGDLVIAGKGLPSEGIVQAQSYELRRVYFQGTDVDTGAVRRVDVGSLDAEAPVGCAGFAKYLQLYSPRYHRETGPVIVRPDDVQIVALSEEIKASAWLAIPGLFWVFVAIEFYKYGVATGRM